MYHTFTNICVQLCGTLMCSPNNLWTVLPKTQFTLCLQWKFLANTSNIPIAQTPKPPPALLCWYTLVHLYFNCMGQCSLLHYSMQRHPVEIIDTAHIMYFVQHGSLRAMYASVCLHSSICRKNTLGGPVFSFYLCDSVLPDVYLQNILQNCVHRP